MDMGFQECIASTILASCILSIWPYHPNLFDLTSEMDEIWREAFYLFQDSNKHLAVGSEKKHDGICQRNGYWSSGQHSDQTDTDPLDSQVQSGQLSDPVGTDPLDCQVQSGQHLDPTDTDHSTARFDLTNIQTQLTMTTRQPGSVWPTFGPNWHWPLDSQIHIQASVPTARYFWVCPFEQDWPNVSAYGMSPYLTVWSVCSKQRAPPLSRAVLWVGNQINIVMTCKLQNYRRWCLWLRKRIE